jgi:hypothetical protein
MQSSLLRSMKKGQRLLEVSAAFVLILSCLFVFAGFGYASEPTYPHKLRCSPRVLTRDGLLNNPSCPLQGF